ncbi:MULTISPECIES: mechanosensitive ion channel family protein [unclassified Aureispira]|uniref:mechanosensitive ion channel family protein n=1 Tax=unclassified Aureispira TaxID=2649989 RepID=UPI0007C7314E|nr:MULTISPECIES: mechanosensitive ion channel family protein [unclassified Aureispira]WMX14111.1 mechanosensitive ion channel family protein [Aureispira sp. CCB-E]
MDEKITDQFQDQMTSSWDKIMDKLAHWVDAIILNLPNLILAILIFTIAYWLSTYVKNWVNKLLRKPIKEASIRGLISNIASIVFITLGLILALNVLNLNDVLTSILAGAGVAGLAVGLALQGTLANTFSGIFLAVRDVISVGDWVETNGYSGSIVEIDLRNTKLKEADNNIVVIPNQMILDNPFKNYGLTTKIRSTIKCGVAYGSDLEAVQEIAKEAIKELYPPQGGQEIEFHYLEFGGSSIDFQLRFWVNATKKLTALEAKSKAMIALKKAFDANNIDIPFPIRTLYVPKIEDKVPDIAGDQEEKCEEEPEKVPEKKASEKWLEREIFNRDKH